ncbi:MAG TPA: sigma 54-interacting transcriptional regulator [Candidatus Wallbacteria bacterium]|nr:sigma 54-interacting transcriptional regulator [Candidatus Wallbacteria bacterium]
MAMPKNNADNINQALDYLDDGVFTVGNDFRITSFNRQAEIITGVKSRAAIGRFCSKVFHTELCAAACPLKKAMSEGRRLSDISVTIKNSKGMSVPVKITAGPLYNMDKKIVGGIEIFKNVSEVENLKKELSGKYSHFDIVGKSPFMMTLFDILPDIAESDCNVLIEGPSGTGKTLVARAIHNISARKNKPFVSVNCGALPDQLLESELFGYSKGAFTGAVSDRKGRFAAAEGGSIFLDEIAEMPVNLQVKLLHVIESKTYEPLGSSKTLNADVRIIAATNSDVSKMCRAQKFREDLYYRLRVVSIKIPPLKDRREDVMALAESFRENLNIRYSKKITGFSDDLLKLFALYEFPGNVRELQNMIENAFVFCKTSKLTAALLPEEYRAAAKKRVSPDGESDSDIYSGPLQKRLDGVEKKIIENAIEKYYGDRGKISNHLKIDKATLWRKMKKHKML